MRLLSCKKLTTSAADDPSEKQVLVNSQQQPAKQPFGYDSVRSIITYLFMLFCFPADSTRFSSMTNKRGSYQDRRVSLIRRRRQEGKNLSAALHLCALS